MCFSFHTKNDTLGTPKATSCSPFFRLPRRSFWVYRRVAFSMGVRFFLCYENNSFSYRHHCCNMPYTVNLIAVYTALMFIIIQLQVFVFSLLTPSVFRRKPAVTHVTSGLLSSCCICNRIFYSRSYVPYRLWCFIDCSIDVFCIVYFTVLLLYLVGHVCTPYRERLPVPWPVPVLKSTLWLFVTLGHHHAQHKVQE